jgi:hypothetical protein
MEAKDGTKFDAKLALDQERMGCPACLLSTGTPGFEMGCKSEKWYRSFCGSRCLNQRIHSHGLNILPAK